MESRLFLDKKVEGQGHESQKTGAVVGLCTLVSADFF